MKTIFKIFMVLVLFASIQYANSADVVKVQRAVPVKPEQLSNPVEPAIKPQSKQTRKSLKSEETPEIKQKKLQELKRESTNYARKHVNMSDEELTKKAIEGKLDPVVGRSEEIERVIQILSRRTKY